MFYYYVALDALNAFVQLDPWLSLCQGPTFIFYDYCALDTFPLRNQTGLTSLSLPRPGIYYCLVCRTSVVNFM